MMTTPLVRELATWFAANARPLPWRERDPGPWGILVVEVMSQQTPIARVEPVWTAWMRRWPTPADVAAASGAEIIRAWGRMGYPRRALNLREAAAAVRDRFGGQVPRTEEELLTLPGVGPYTAAAVMAFGHGLRSVVLDTNIRRVLTRVLDGVALPPPHLGVQERERAATLVPAEEERAVEWNAAVMEFGALVCTARAPGCATCPLTACRWREEGFPDNAPLRRAQAWHGSTRQLRGAIMAHLREREAPSGLEQILERVLAEHSWAHREQVEQALGGLLTDALVREVDPGGGGTYSLPH